MGRSGSSTWDRWRRTSSISRRCRCFRVTAVTGDFLATQLKRWGGIALVLACALLLVAPIEAEAHAFLVKSSPAAGQRVLASPQVLRLDFSEPVVLAGSRVSIQTSGSRLIDTGALQRSAERTALSVQLPKLGEGTYLVTWQALSEDGHPSSGDFVFGIGVAAVLPAVTIGATPPTDWPEALATCVVIARQ